MILTQPNCHSKPTERTVEKGGSRKESPLEGESGLTPDGKTPPNMSSLSSMDKTIVTAVRTVTRGYSDDGTLCGLDPQSRPLKVLEGGL